MGDDKKEYRKQLFQQVLDGADDEFFTFAANRLHTEAQMRLIQLPCHSEHPATNLAPKKTVAAEPPKPKKVKNKVPEKTPVTKPSYWVKVMDAPIVKSKANKKVALHMANGATAKAYSVWHGWMVGTIMSCGMNTFKMQIHGSGAIKTFAYNADKIYIDLMSHDKYKKLKVFWPKFEVVIP